MAKKVAEEQEEGSKAQAPSSAAPEEEEQESESSDGELLPVIPRDLRAKLLDTHNRWFHENAAMIRQPLRERLLIAFVLAGFEPWNHVTAIASCKFGFRMELKDVQMQAEFRSAHRWASHIGAVHATSCVGAVGILKRLSILGSHTLDKAGWWAKAKPGMSDLREQEEFVMSCATQPRNQSGMLFYCSGFLQWKTMSTGHHSDEAAVVKRRIASHHKGGRRWAIPLGGMTLERVWIQPTAFERAESLFQ